MTVGWEAGVRDPARLSAVERCGLVGTASEDAFDRLTELATELVAAPRGCITLVDTSRTTAKSAVGFPEGSLLSAPIEESFCRFVVGSGRPLVVDDARLDPRTQGDPAIETFQAVAWAGFPIEDADGAILGAFCVMDPNTHEWTARDLHVLATLAKAASSEIALRALQRRMPGLSDELRALRAENEHQRAVVMAHVDALLELDQPMSEIGQALLDRFTDSEAGGEGQE